MTEEQKRINEKDASKKDWLKWGPYLSERQWGTVREDYSPYGDAWNYFSHENARSRAYRWGEDGIAGISDRYCNICFGIALWNGKDPILKERLYGLTGPQGNHGEDVKELYYYLDNTPTHSYMRHLYKYPQKEFPYAQLVHENQNRNRKELEFELCDTGIFDSNEYFDVYTEYAKADYNDILITITVSNRSKKRAPLHLLPTLTMRNHWSFKDMPSLPKIKANFKDKNPFVTIDHPYVNGYRMYFDEASQLLFTENDTNMEKVYNAKNDQPYKKDFFHAAVINNDYKLASKKTEGTKFSPMYKMMLKGGESRSFQLRLTDQELEKPFSTDFKTTLKNRRAESDDFYKTISKNINAEQNAIQKQAFAGLLWTKQYYNYEVEKWLQGDAKASQPAWERLKGRNTDWKTLRNHDVLSMPDAWEYPWYAAWDSAFHCTTFALIDPTFAKEQLLLFTKEWYMAPNGQIPAYEWSFSDVNPPVQAWAAINIYEIDKKKTGKGDIKFLKRMFNKLSLNFTWWVNRLDTNQNNVFEGGFLGLDNIGVFDRSNGVPGNGILQQVDGTAWMALYCLNMLEMSLEIAMVDDSYEDMTVKYFGHFIFIAEALNKINKEYEGTWDNEEGFFYDKLILPNGEYVPIKVRSIAGMLSLAAVLTIKEDTLNKLPNFKASVLWFKKYRMETLKYPVIQDFAEGDDLLLSLVPKDRVKILMESLLDEKEFLSPYGIRSLSKIHEKPYHINIEGVNYDINYEPAESTVSLFGGNSNWRGPVWFPLNYLFIQAINEHHKYCDNSLKFDFPTGSGNQLELNEISAQLSKKLINLFEKDNKGNRPINEQHQALYKKEHFEDLILFYEYFHGDTGRGLGASHQTGWTALVANLISEVY